MFAKKQSYDTYLNKLSLIRGDIFKRPAYFNYMYFAKMYYSTFNKDDPQI